MKNNEMSEERKQYLARIKREKIAVLFTQIMLQ